MNNKVISKVVSGVLLCSMIGYTLPVFAYTKDETVYSKLDASGDGYKTIVSTHIKNEENEDLIKDMSDLLNIKNTSGDETYTQDGNTFTWKANKNDIYYQGESSKDLPIECIIKYELDGEEISPEDIAGKSGNVKITIQYSNKEERIVDINGKKVKMYVPFVVVAGTIVKNEVATNVQVSSGKVIDDGTKTIVVGMAMPGLQESLGVSDKDIEISSDIEITMDAKDFESNSIVSFVTPKVLDEEDLSIFDKLDEVYSQVNTLQVSSKQIEEGANTLKDGAINYSEKSKEFNGAMNQVSEGVSSINSNYSKIDSGINSLNAGSSSLVNGAQQLNSGINELETKLSSLPESVSQLYKGSVELNLGVNSENGLVNGINTVKDSLEATIKTLSANVTTLTNTKNQLIEAGYLESDEIIMSLQKQITIDIATLTKLTSEQAQANLNALDNGVKSISQATQKLEQGLGQLNAAANQLPTALTQLVDGSKALVDGSKTLKSGASTLRSGSTSLKSGMKKLDVSTKELTSANGQLTDGAATIANGATDLVEGIHTFNRDGIDKICNFMKNNVKDLTDRVEKLTELSKDYNNFTMINEGNDGDVKFVMIIDGVKKQQESEQNKENAVLNDVLKDEKND